MWEGSGLRDFFTIRGKLGEFLVMRILIKQKSPQIHDTLATMYQQIVNLMNNFLPMHACMHKINFFMVMISIAKKDKTEYNRL